MGDDNRKKRDRQSGNRYFVDNVFIKQWGAKLGPHCIAVYNVLVMHANADTQEAYPSFQTIADLVGISRRQAMREIEKLKANNIIKVEDRKEIAPESGKPYFLSNIFTLLHPDEWGKPVDICLHETSDTQSLPLVTHSHYPSDTQSPPLVTPSHLNNTNLNKTQLTRGDRQSQPSSSKVKPGPVSQALLEVCRLDWDYVDNEPSIQAPFKKMLDFLAKKGAQPGDISEFGAWRKDHHWTGKDGSAPTLKQVGELWGQYQQWVTSGRTNGNQQKVSIGAK